jgi:hypothetical protein
LYTQPGLGGGRNSDTATGNGAGAKGETTSLVIQCRTRPTYLVTPEFLSCVHLAREMAEIRRRPGYGIYSVQSGFGFLGPYRIWKSFSRLIFERAKHARKLVGDHDGSVMFSVPNEPADIMELWLEYSLRLDGVVQCNARMGSPTKNKTVLYTLYVCFGHNRPQYLLHPKSAEERRQGRTKQLLPSIACLDGLQILHASISTTVVTVGLWALEVSLPQGTGLAL